MPELVIKSAIKNGDLRKDYKKITLEQALDFTYIKKYYEAYRKDMKKPSIFDKSKQ